MTISSDLGVAQQRATSLSNAVTSISESTLVTKDTQTTVAGNTSASTAIQAASNTATSISSAVELASSNIQSVAHEFEAADQESRRLIMMPPSIPSPMGGKK